MTSLKMAMSANIIPLLNIKTGQWFKIHKIPTGSLRSQFIRLGIHEGERVKCLERLPGGTLILQKNRQQIAIGHTLAKKILVVTTTHSEREK